MHIDPSVPNTRLIDTYRQQMMDMYRQAVPSPAAADTADNWLDSRFPVPDIPRDKESMEPSPSLAASNDFNGYLRVYAFTAGGAEPIVGAQILVTRPNDETETIYANLTTDQDGFTAVIPLPSVDPALTLQPGTILPYVAYTIQATADGFQSVVHRSVPVYGDNYVTQPIAMIPSLPTAMEGKAQEFTSSGPTNL